MKKTLLFIPFLTLLFAGCGQTPASTTGVTTGKELSSAALDAQARYDARKAAAQAALAQPAEPLESIPATPLSTAYPGGVALVAQNVNKTVPIVLVHGMMGFGRDEMLGLKYWGGVQDVQEDLKALGYQVFTVSIGPVSSDWDRAVETYTEIKGGCVDYGSAHSREAGHSRTDSRKCYSGLYPQWDAQHPVNLIGHSMGAPTSRLLVKLLDDGSPADAADNNLFVGGRHGWVKNIMTISGPNTGSPAADNLEDYLPFFKDMLMGMGLAAGENPVYDFQLGQFGIYRDPNETYGHYVNRVMDPASSLWKSSDQGPNSLRVDSAYRQNQFIGRSPYTKYFSWATSATSRGLVTGWYYPNPDMFAPMIATSYPYPAPLPNGLGNMTGSSPEKLITYDPSWWESDGIVPVRVQNEPIGESAEDYRGQSTQPGGWYRLGKLSGYDHMDITGNFTTRDVMQFYRNQAAFLSSQ